ncbi:MAG: hypothetical protein FJX67_11200 [Alphaproteobacteria bacterium]|nr:hypothetical protein [Alphaproteobacteria bacterium]
MSWIVRTLNRLARDRADVSMVEIALVMPVLVTTMIGGVEIARFVLLEQKLDRVAATVADLISQAETITATEVDGLFDAIEHVAKPFEVMTKGRVILSSITGQSTGGPVLNWQRSNGDLSDASSGVASGGSVTLPAGFSLAAGDTVIIAEAYFDYTPLIFSGVLDDKRLYHRAMFRPRFGSLQTLG